MIIATLLLIILAYPLYHFGLRRAHTRTDARRYLPAFITFGLLLLLTAAFSLNDLLDVFVSQDLEVIDTMQALDAAITTLESDDETLRLFTGQVGDLPVGVNIPRLPQTSFPLRLQGGEVTVTLSEGILAINWPQVRGSRALIAGQQIVVLGNLQATVPINTNTDIQDERYITAQTIYAGPYEAYIDYLPRFAIIPGLTLLLSLLTGLAVLIGPLLYLRRLPTSVDANSQ